MVILVTILIIIACAVLAFFVLIQSPKGGGLTGTFGNMSTAVMGVKQSTDVIEKGTWVSVSVIAGLCIVCVFFLHKPQGSTDTKSNTPTSNTKKR